MSRMRITSLVLVLGLAMSAHAQDSTASPSHPQSDFAFGITLTPSTQRAVHTALVPLEVYRGVTRDDLGDLRVFNAAGEQVPHAVRTLDQAREVEAASVSLPIFPLRAEPSAELSPSALDSLALRVTRDGQGTIVEIRLNGNGAAAEAAEPVEARPTNSDAGIRLGPIIAYVLDATALDRPIVALQVTLGAAQSDYVLPVRVEASEDLARFTGLGGEHALVRLAYAGQSIERGRIDLPSVRARYLRLRWSARELPAPIESVRAVLAAEHAQPPLHQMRVRGSRRADLPGAVYEFNLGGPVPADYVRVELPQDNSVILAELASSAQPTGAFRTAYRGTFYRVSREGENLHSAPLTVARHSDRYWRLTVEDKGGGLGNAVPELEVSYHPDQLLFVARGQAPFTLAYGHYDAQPSSFSADSLLAPLSDVERSSLPTSDSETGAQQSLAGPSALFAPAAPPPFKQYALWGVLIAGVALLGVAALRLARKP